MCMFYGKNGATHSLLLKHNRPFVLLATSKVYYTRWSTIYLLHNFNITRKCRSRINPLFWLKCDHNTAPFLEKLCDVQDVVILLKNVNCNVQKYHLVSVSITFEEHYVVHTCIIDYSRMWLLRPLPTASSNS